MKAEEVWNAYQMVQHSQKVIHCITNHVTVNDCANILLAAGVSPTMAHHPAEVAEVTSACDGLVCNLGATDDFAAMKTAYEEAAKRKHPIIIDPVGVGASSFRRLFFEQLTQERTPTCIRGNYAEIDALSCHQNTTIGVDDRQAQEKDITYYEQCVVELSKKKGCFVVASGKTDIVSDGKNVYHIDNGDKWMTKITGAGCMSTCVIAAYLCSSQTMEAVLSASIVMGICGEIATKKTKQQHGGTMTFRNFLIDQMSQLQKEEVTPRISRII